MAKQKNKSRIKLITLIFILLALPITVFLSQNIQNLINHAAAPERQIALGVSLPYGAASKDENISYQIAEIERFASPVEDGGVGAYPASYSIWTRFGDSWLYGARSTFPNKKLLDYLDSKNITPMIFMEPVGPGMRTSDGTINSAQKYSNEAIANGSMDSFFITWANEAKKYNRPVILRYAHEMNGNWFPWSPDVKDSSNYIKVGNNSQNYIDAWRHIYSVIKPIAPNVKFFWCPNIIQNLNNNTMKQFYPGNDYVDFVGFDGYNRHPNTKTNLNFDELFNNSILALREITTGDKNLLSSKPIIIGETGTLINNPNRNEKINFRVIYGKFPDIKGITYFDIDMNRFFGVTAENGINWKLNGKSNDPDNASLGTDIRLKFAGFYNDARLQGKYFPSEQNTISAQSIENIASTSIDGSPVGYHDYATCTETAGWTCDPSNFNSNITVNFYMDGLPFSGGKSIGSMTASSSRESAVGALCGGNSMHGFKFTLPNIVKDGKTHTIYAISNNIGAGYNFVLGKSPKKITCQP